MLTPNELVFTYGGVYIFKNFGENRSRIATVRVRTDGYTDILTDATLFVTPSPPGGGLKNAVSKI